MKGGNKQNKRTAMTVSDGSSSLFSAVSVKQASADHTPTVFVIHLRDTMTFPGEEN